MRFLKMLLGGMMARRAMGGGRNKQQQPHHNNHNTYNPGPVNAAHTGGAYAAQCKEIEAALPGNIREILQTEFAGYEVAENQVFGDKVDFLVKKDGKVALAVAIHQPGKKRCKRVHAIEKECTAAGAGIVYFRTDFNNPDFPFSREHAVKYLRKQIK